MKISFFQKYGKVLGSAAFAVYATVVPLWSGDHHIDPSEGIIIALAVANAITVYVVPVTKSFGGLKTVVNAISAGLVVAQTQIAGGLDGNDWYLIIGAVVSVFGVLALPAYSPNERVLVTAGSDKPVLV